MASDLSLPRKIGLGVVFAWCLVGGLGHFLAGFCVASVPPSVSR